MLRVLLASAAVAAAPLPGIKLKLKETGERVLVDTLGRERQFHGTNTIVKGPPWIPSRDGFDPLTSLTKEDFQQMQRAGLNSIRLGVMWPGVEPQRGKYNETYLRMIREIADEAAEYGIYTLADMHQDLLSERFCGEGIPLWASEPEETIGFPLPLAMPYPTDPATGLPTREACAKKNWPSYHGAVATGSGYERLYTNHNNLTNAWGGFWEKVAMAFDNASHLLGLELINEPFIGNPYVDPLHLLPTYGDEQRLQPAYDVLAGYIRKVAPERLIFFAGCTWDRTGDEIVDILPFGFKHPPGGAEFADRSVNAFHYYEPPQDKKKTPQYFEQRLKDARKLHIGTFLTESSRSAGVWERSAPMADELGISWMQWEWKDFCKETDETRKSLSQNGAYGACKTGFGGGPYPGGVFSKDTLRNFARTYAPAIQGSFSSASFNATTGDFMLSYKLDPRLGDAAPTVISASSLVYENGFTLTAEPKESVMITLTPTGAEIRAAAGATVGVEVKVTLVQK